MNTNITKVSTPCLLAILRDHAAIRSGYEKIVSEINAELIRRGVL